MLLYRDTLDGFIRNMQAQVAELRSAILEEREARNPRKWSIHSERMSRKVVDNKLLTLTAELKACKRRFVDYQALPESDVRKALDRIEARGNIHIDIGRDPGQVYLLRPITFVRRVAGDAPDAAFCQPELAHAICADLAEAAKLFDCSVAVEGHTKGGESEFWQVLANNRARLVAEKINSLGVESDKITCQGLPGKLGLNDSVTVVRMDIKGFERHLCLERRVTSSVENGTVDGRSSYAPSVFMDSWMSSPSASRAPSPSVSRMVSSAVPVGSYENAAPIQAFPVSPQSRSVPYIENRVSVPNGVVRQTSMPQSAVVAVPRVAPLEAMGRVGSGTVFAYADLSPRVSSPGGGYPSSQAMTR